MAREVKGKGVLQYDDKLTVIRGVIGVGLGTLFKLQKRRLFDYQSNFQDACECNVVEKTVGTKNKLLWQHILGYFPY
jgi:hypothetical protein